MSHIKDSQECKDSKIPWLSKIKTQNITDYLELTNLEKGAIEAMIKKLVAIKPQSVSDDLTNTYWKP